MGELECRDIELLRHRIFNGFGHRKGNKTTTGPVVFHPYKILSFSQIYKSPAQNDYD